MDSSTAGGLGIFGILISAGGIVYSAINHKKFRCRCCGKVMDASIDIDPTEPIPVVVKKKKPVENEMEEGTLTPPPQLPPIRLPSLPPLPPLPPRKKHRRNSVAPAPPITP